MVNIDLVLRRHGRHVISVGLTTYGNWIWNLDVNDGCFDILWSFLRRCVKNIDMTLQKCCFLCIVLLINFIFLQFCHFWQSIERHINIWIITMKSIWNMISWTTIWASPWIIITDRVMVTLTHHHKSILINIRMCHTHTHINMHT